jgi:aspartyl-tRNA(Asn)/glutamyl-tRNA(Gln) amidotransferase subunit A
VSDLNPIAALGEALGILTAAEAYDFHFALMQGPDRGRVDPRVIDRIERGRTMSARDLIVIQRARRRLAEEVAAALEGAVLAMPTTPITAPEIAPLEADKSLFHTVNLKALRNTMIGNFLDLCGLALPSGTDERGLPTGLLLSAPGGDDVRLLSVALAAEAALGD